MSKGRGRVEQNMSQQPRLFLCFGKAGRRLIFFLEILGVSEIVLIFAAKTEIMCTVTLSYDANNQLAQQQLQFLLSTGLFTQISTDGELDIDYSDPQLYEENDLPIPSNRNLSLDELEQMVVADIRNHRGCLSRTEHA